MGALNRAVAAHRRFGRAIGRFAAIVGAGLAVGCASLGFDRTECGEEAAWVSEIESVAAAGSQISQSEYEWTEGLIARPDSETIGCLISLLDSENREVRDLSAYALSQIDGLEQRHVKPVLRAALKPEAGGALPWVLARIDSKDAVQGMVQLLRSGAVAFGVTAGVWCEAVAYGERLDRDVDGWSANAGIAARHTEALGRVLESRESGDEAIQRVVLAILALAGQEREVPVDPLVRMASDPRRSASLRRETIAVLGFMGTTTAQARAVLRDAEASSSADLASAASAALFSIEGPQPETSYERSLALLENSGLRPAPSHRDWIDQWAYHDLFSSMARIWTLGEHARGAVPMMIRLLSETAAAEVRIQAAWTLGFLGDPSSGSALVEILQDPDWILVAVAAESLGRLGYRPASETLRAVATDHWYPPIREIAGQAVEVLRGKYTYPVHQGSDVPEAFRREGHMEQSLPGAFPEPCVDPDSDSPVPRRDGFFGWSTSKAQAERHTYTLDGVIYDFGPRNARLDVVPDFGVRVEGGWLLASHRGEFGGELVFQPENAPFQIVARGNFEDVHTMIDGRRVATEGLAHMGSDHGSLFELREDGDGWSARWWRRLPGEPQTSWIRRDGTLLVNASRGSVVVHPDGRMEMASCTPKQDAAPSGADR